MNRADQALRAIARNAARLDRSRVRTLASCTDFFVAEEPVREKATLLLRDHADGHCCWRACRDSFNINDEISVAIYDAAVAEELARAFQEDVRGAERWTLERWNGRSFGHRVRDRASVLVKRQL